MLAVIFRFPHFYISLKIKKKVYNAIDNEYVLFSEHSW